MDGMDTMEVLSSPMLTAAAVAVSTTLCLVFWCVCRRSGKVGRLVCLLGPSNSGKTLLLFRLKEGDYVRTHSSMKENVFSYPINKGGKTRHLQLVDIPGDERLTGRLFDERVTSESVVGVVMVIDSLNITGELRQTSHLMIDLLSHSKVYSKKVSILVACNKQDLALASSAEHIKELLETEITQILTNPSVKLSSIDQSKEKKTMQLLRKGEETFKFDRLPNDIQFVSCSARGAGEESVCSPELSGVVDWLHCL